MIRITRVFAQLWLAVQKMYNSFLGSMDKLEIIRRDHIKKMNEMIIPAVLYYPEKIREFKRKLNDIENTKKSIDKMGEELTRAKTKMEQDKIRDINVDSCLFRLN